MPTTQGGAGSSLSPALLQLAHDYITWRLSDTPEFASLAGIHDYDDRLDDMSLQAYQDRLDQCQTFLERVNVLEADLTLHVDQVNLKFMKADLTSFMDGFPFKGFLVPLSYLTGVHVDSELLISWMLFETFEDYEKLLSRFEKLPTQLSQVQELLEEGVKTGIVNHKISMKYVSESLGKFVVDTAEDSPLWKPLSSFPKGFTQEQITDLQGRGRSLITSKIAPAFQRLRNFVDTSYVTRPDIAVTSLPDGEARYRQLVRFHTTTSMTPEEIHQLGVAEVARLEGEMAKVVHELGYDMSVHDFSAKIRNDPKFYYHDPDNLLKGVDDLMHKVIEPKIPEVFTNPPKAELMVVPNPSPQGTTAFYQPGAHDGSRPGIYKVNTELYKAIPKYDLMTLSLHEGTPGHHLQFSMCLESPNLPLFRRLCEDRNYSQAPSRFPMYTAFMEGWALYAESLGFDMNLFDDLYDRYGYYSNDIYRACRLVVDTGLHTLGWTRQQAIDYMLQHTALTPKNVENEVDRYITIPGQALGYKIGQLKIKELRERAASALGESFSLKEFHDVVLEGVGPLDLLEEEVDAWLSARKAS